MTIESGTKILAINLNAVHKYYEQFSGSGKAVSKQTIEAYFTSNPAYMGYSRGVRYSWLDVIDDYRGAFTPGGDKDESLLDPTATRKMKRESRTAPSHIFNYDILKSLTNIDLEHLEDEEENEKASGNTSEPPMLTDNNENTPF